MHDAPALFIDAREAILSFDPCLCRRISYSVRMPPPEMCLDSAQRINNYTRRQSGLKKGRPLVGCRAAAGDTSTKRAGKGSG